MIAEACITDNILHIRYSLLGGLGYKYCFDDKIGYNLVEFSAVNISDLSQAYDNLLNYVLKNKEKIASDKNILLKYVSKNAKTLMLDNAYMAYFNNLCISFMFKAISLDKLVIFNEIKQVIDSSNATVQSFIEFFDPIEDDNLNKYEFFRKNESSSYSFDKFAEQHPLIGDDFFIYLIKSCFIEEILIFHKRINTELDCLFNDTAKAKNLKPLQKLFLLDYNRQKNGIPAYYTSVKFPTYIKPVALDEESRFDVFLENKTYTIDNIENITIAETVEISHINDLFCYEMINIVTYDAKIKKCENCHKYFMLKNRKASAKYCDRVPKGAKEPCYVIGAGKKYAHSEKHPSVMLYNKVYKRFDYHFRQTGNISMFDFDTWKWYATELRDKCKSGEISMDEFKRFMKLDFENALKEATDRS